MLEIELKFQIPLADQEPLYQVFVAKNARAVSLYAKYYDTPDRHLARQKISLRQRLENAHWIQTLKAPSHNHLERFELEIDLGELDNPALDLDIYDCHPHAKKLFKNTLGQETKNLSLQFETAVNRLIHVVHFNHSEIEISLDRGEIRQDDQTLAIYEIEFELKQGCVEDLIKCIQPWVKQYHLWLDVRSKAQRGDLLAQHLTISAVQHVLPLELNQKDTPDHALKLMVNNALQHLLPNMTAISAEQYTSEHVHQTRVAIRRLRTALRIFSNWSDYVEPHWEEQLATIFRQLGATRDRDALSEGLLPQLEADGAPFVQLPTIKDENSHSIEHILKAGDSIHLILALLQFVHQPTKKKKKEKLKKQSAKKLQKLHQQIYKDAQQFLELDIEARHRTRKRIKRLRYSVEFVASLYSKKDVKQYLNALKPAQESLGQYNDLIVAETLFQDMVKRKQKLWFALGWIANEKKAVLEQARQNLEVFSETQNFWS